jgi:hypothetical protein
MPDIRSDIWLYTDTYSQILVLSNKMLNKALQITVLSTKHLATHFLVTKKISVQSYFALHTGI